MLRYPILFTRKCQIFFFRRTDTCIREKVAAVHGEEECGCHFKPTYARYVVSNHAGSFEILLLASRKILAMHARARFALLEIASFF